MNSIFVDRLSELESTLIRVGFPVNERLNPGLEPELVEAMLEPFGDRLNSFFVTMFSWRDGTANPGDEITRSAVFGFFRMYTLEEAILQYRVSVSDGLWAEDLFPVFTTDAGDQLLFSFDWMREDPPVFLYNPRMSGQVEPVTIYDSTDLFLETVTLCYADGAYVVRDQELLVDAELENLMSAALNPGAQYWQ